MNGVVVSVKGRYAVLLNKNGEFVKVKNKNYLVGDMIKVPQYRGQILSVAASVIAVCGGISSYFIPAKYMSVDINPSVMMTINIYNRVIDTEPLNNDAQVLLSETDVNGMRVADGMDELIKKSEEIGYLNGQNKDVIIEVVEGIGKINLPDKNYGDVEVIIENADKTDLKNAKTMGVSIAKAKAIAEYTKQNGGSIEENADKLEKKSVKEIRKNLENKVEAKSENNTKVEQNSVSVQNVESEIEQKNQSTMYIRIENIPTKTLQGKRRVNKKSSNNNNNNNNIVEKDNGNSYTDEKQNNMFDDSITKITFNPIQEVDKNEFVFKPVSDDAEVEENKEKTILQEDKSDGKNETIVPSETLKPIVSEKTIEPEQDKHTEEARPQPSYGGHTKPNNNPNNSIKNEPSNEEIADKPNDGIENRPPKTDKSEEKPPQDDANNRPQEPQKPGKPFGDMDTPPENIPNNRPQEPSLDHIDEKPYKPEGNLQPPIENDKPPQEPDDGNGELPDFNRPNVERDFENNQNENPAGHNKDFNMPPSENSENDNSSMTNDGPNFIEE